MSASIPTPKLKTNIVSHSLECLPKQSLIAEGNLLTTEVKDMSRLRSRSQTKTNEDADIDRIMLRINEQTENPTKLSELCDGRRIVKAYRLAGSGNRKIHYDFCVDVENPDGSIQTGMRVEHKGSNDKKPIDPTRRLGVQFHNGSPKLSVMMTYLSLWYTYWISSGRLTDKYGIQSPVPTLDEWVKRDAMVQGDPKTPYGVELKRLSRERNGPKSSLTEERDEFMENIFKQEMVTTEDLEELKKHVIETANNCLQEKDLWLQIAGDIHGDESDFYHLWMPKMAMIEAIENVEIKLESKKNVEFVLECRSQNTEDVLQPTSFMKIVGIMRWGKGQGFSNFRFDLK